MREGLNYVLKKKTFMTIALYALCINFFMSSFSILLPYNLITTHGISPEMNGFIQSIFPIGAILMSIYVGRKNTQFSQSLFRNTMLMFGAIMLAFAYPVLPNVALGDFIPIYYALLMGLIGMVVILVNVPLSVMFQVSLEDEFRGRAMGLFGSLSQGVMPISYLLTGFLLDVVPSYGILIVNAIALILIAISIQRNVQLKAVAVH
jgi:MFS family permease